MFVSFIAKRKIFLLVLLILLVGLFGYTKLSGQVVPPKEDEAQKYLRRISKIYELINSSYVRDASAEEVFSSAMKGMLKNLDPYSDYFTVQEFEDFSVAMKGEFGGIGTELSMEDGILTVITPLEDTPAFRAGILAGDRILEVDGVSTEGLSMAECGKRIRGIPGTKVTLTILHRGVQDTVKFTIVREVIKISSIKQAKIIDEKEKIAYLRITSFQEDTIRSFDEAIQKLKAKGMKFLIIDLRFNGGGIMQTAIDLSNRFISQGTIVSMKGKNKESNKTYLADPQKAILSDLPLIILINGSSASASEIFAGAIQDYKKGILIGSRSFGKGSVQTVFPLPDEKAAVKLTIAKYYTPLGRSLHKEKDKNYGLDPDILVEMTPQQEADLLRSRSKEDIIELEPSKVSPPKFDDIQLKKALEILALKDKIEPLPPKDNDK
jgi:carboxyl-terminal processing protease